MADDQEQQNPVPMVDRLAYVLQEWEEAHAGWSDQTVNGRAIDPATNERYAQLKTECECQHCKDARVVLADYDAGVR